MSKATSAAAGSQAKTPVVVDPAIAAVIRNRAAIDHAEQTHARYGELYRYVWAAQPTVMLWDVADTLWN